jgi:hypothetical protein
MRGNLLAIGMGLLRRINVSDGKCDFRYTPDSRHHADRQACPFRAQQATFARLV